VAVTTPPSTVTARAYDSTYGALQMHTTYLLTY